MFENVEKKIRQLDFSQVPKYQHYFKTIKPLTKEDVLRRGLFALASVHTTYQSNVNLYAALWDLKWIGDPELLRNRIVQSRAGLTNNRTKFIMDFAALFLQFPSLFEHKASEPWYATRDRIESNVKGLGMSKSAFMLELVYLEDCRSVCMDVHMLRLFGVDTADVAKVTKSDMVRMETYWDMLSRELGVSPTLLRWLYWDSAVQRKSDSRYWSHVLEGEPKINDPQLRLFDEGEKADDK